LTEKVVIRVVLSLAMRARTPPHDGLKGAARTSLGTQGRETLSENLVYRPWSL
jgi:hypothetical protein